MNGIVRLVPSVPEAFADLVVTELSTASAGYALFLSGGGTAVECYRTLATRPAVAWGGVDVYLGDERCVPPDDPDSNHRVIVETLLDVVGPVRSDHPMYTSGAPAEAAAAYQELVVAVIPDLVHLGLGPDGHTASLFPGSVALDDTDATHLVVATTDPNGVNIHERITLTYAGIARARRTVVTVAGASKRDALGRLLAGEDLPAGRLTGNDLLWLVDADALGDASPDAA
ncbi:MAG TPA: 6-phosphogluconolactonase [Acidimicrobiales bacterium]